MSGIDHVQVVIPPGGEGRAPGIRTAGRALRWSSTFRLLVPRMTLDSHRQATATASTGSEIPFSWRDRVAD
jgi:hypothetical protein